YRCEVRAAVLLERFQVERSAADNDGDEFVVAECVRDAAHGDLVDPVESCHDGFDAFRIDFVAAEAQRGLLSPGDDQEIVSLEPCYVARIEPAVPESTFRILRIAEIALHGELAPDAQQPLAPDRQNCAVTIDGLRRGARG